MDWKQILDTADDDYLTGISNKGIVKRAYKDKEELGELPQITLDHASDHIDIAIGGENVSISYPLADSKCSCPSRSVCRHIILGILLSKACAGEMAETEKEEAIKEAEEIKEVEEIKEAEVSNLQQVKTEIKEYPVKKLIRALGKKRLRNLAETAEKGEFPKIEQTTIITVHLPVQGNIVKLLSPLEYAACTCHKKELCSHKAEAMLWYSLQEKWISLEELKAELEQESDFDKERVVQIAEQISTYLEELLLMGLSRTSNEVVYALERLAVIAHTARLPRVEYKLRTLVDDYKDYLNRSAGFSIYKTLHRIVNLYEEMQLLPCAETNIEIEKLAGEFHAEYKPAGDLELVGVTWEHFVSQSGYEGDTVYFLEISTGRWYTFTNARPVFYEQKKRGGYREKAQAPWGITASFEDMVNLHIRLRGAKCDETGRLSSTQEARGEILGNRELTKELLKHWYYTDFGKLFEEQIGLEADKESQIRQEKLALIQPASMEKAKFEEIEQTLRMVLYDEKGRKVYIEVPFSKKEEQTIRYLEHLKADEKLCFLGKIYLKNSEIYMYPLDLFRKKELPWIQENELISEAAEDNEKGCANTEAQDTLQSLLEEVELFLEDFYQVGFQTIQYGLLDNLKELEEKTQIYGLEQLSIRLGILREMLDTKRHNIVSKEDQEIIRKYRELCKYIWIGKTKTTYDKARIIYLLK